MAVGALMFELRESKIARARNRIPIAHPQWVGSGNVTAFPDPALSGPTESGINLENEPRVSLGTILSDLYQE